MRQELVAPTWKPHNLRKRGFGHLRYEYPIARIPATAARSDMLSAATSLIAQTFFAGWLAPARTRDVLQGANRPLKAVIGRAMRNDEGGCTICVWEIPPDGLNAFGARSQTITFADRQLSRGTQIEAELELVVVERFSRRRSSGSNHLREEQFSASLNVNSSSLRHSAPRHAE